MHDQRYAENAIEDRIVAPRGRERGGVEMPSGASRVCATVQGMKLAHSWSPG